MRTQLKTYGWATALGLTLAAACGTTRTSDESRAELFGSSAGRLATETAALGQAQSADSHHPSPIDRKAGNHTGSEAASEAVREPVSEAALAVVTKAKAYRLTSRAPRNSPPEPNGATQTSTSPVLPASLALDFNRDGRRLRPRFSDGAWKTVLHNAHVTLPEHANEPFHLRDDASSLAVTVTLEGAKHVRAEVADGYLVYPNAAPGGGDVLHRANVEGTEDYVLYEAKPAAKELHYRVALGQEVAGMRMLQNSGTLEFIDPSGAPRLRMNAPYAVDGNGERRELTVRVDGCAYDRDPRAPWGRRPTAPGATECTVAITLPEEGYPLLVDPAWTATGSMPVLRFNFDPVRLKISGNVLVLSNNPGFGNTLLFNEGTATWAQTADRVDYNASIILLADGRPFVTGGNFSAQKADVYDESTGSWIGVAPMAHTRYYHSSALLNDGRVLLIGGIIDSKFGNPNDGEIYNPVTDSWSAAAHQFGQSGKAVTLDDGRVLYKPDISAEAFVSDATISSWTATTGVSFVASPSIAMVKLKNGKVLAGSRIFDPATNAWEASGYSGAPGYYGATLLGSQKALFAGGCACSGTFETAPNNTPTDSSFLFDPATSVWQAVGNLTVKRSAAGMVMLPSGKVLMAGGYTKNGVDGVFLTSAELFGLVPGNGYCLVDGECISGHCSDGVCCDAACKGLCESCTAAKKGFGSDGACEPIAVATDPESECSDDGSPGCSQNGWCDGKGGCQTYPLDKDCAAEPCSKDANCTSEHCFRENPADLSGLCCDQACGEPCLACTVTTKGSGKDGLCEPIAAGTDPKGACPQDKNFPKSCKADGECNGSGDCREFALAKLACANDATCSDGNTTLIASECDGGGTCVNAKTLCDPFKCKDAACLTFCATSADCANAGDFCNEAKCAPKRANGEVCSLSDSCTSGLCKDGTCRQSCASDKDCTTPNSWCTEGACFPKLDTGAVCELAPSCKSSFCTDSVCCEAANCGAFRCGKGGLCATTCASSGDCGTGYRCNSEGSCLPALPAELVINGCAIEGTPGSHGGSTSRLALVLAAAWAMQSRRRRRARAKDGAGSLWP